MEIEFNTSRIPPAESRSPAVRKDTPPAATDAASFSTSNALKSRFENISAVRPEQVARAQALVSDASYPPDYVLDRIAVLLALHTGENAPASSDK